MFDWITGIVPEAGYVGVFFSCCSSTSSRRFLPSSSCPGYAAAQGQLSVVIVNFDAAR